MFFGAEGVGDEAPLHFFEGVAVVFEDQHGVGREGGSCGEFKAFQFFVGPFGLEVREAFAELVVFGFEGDVVTHGVKFGKMGEMGWGKYRIAFRLFRSGAKKYQLELQRFIFKIVI